MNAPLKKLSESEAGRFATELRDSSIYLTVMEKNANPAVTLKAILEQLKSLDAVNIDEASVNKALTVMNSPVIAARIDKPRIVITVASDEMKAAACLEGNKFYMNFSKNDILEELKKQGVVFGLQEKHLDEVIANPGKQFVVASGKEAIFGKDAEIVFKQNISEEKGRPKEVGGGRVCYKDLDLFSAVLENEIIAEKIPAVHGENGTTVRGKVVKTTIGKDKRIKLGKNVVIEEDFIVSKIAGHLVVTADKIEVLPVLEINSDIDLSTGNINFPGNVSIKGDVQTGFSVKANGNVLISGSVFGGTVEGKSIEVRYGVQSVGASYVKAEESIKAKFMENAVVYAGSDVTVTDTILHSRVSAGRRVMVTGSKGLIAGGYITAGEIVDSKNIGTQMAPPTIVEVGVNPLLKEEYLKLKDHCKEAKAKQEGVGKSLLLIKPDEAAVVPENRQEIYFKLTKMNFTLLGSIAEAEERLAFIEGEFDKMRDCSIKCSGYIFPGVKLVINNTVYPIRDVLQFATFLLDNGEVKFVAYNN